MPIISRDPLNPGVQTRTESTTSEVVGATFQQAWQSGVTSNFMLNNLLDADEEGRQQSQNSLARFGRLYPDEAPGKKLTAQDARQQLTDAGLEDELSVPETGIGKESLQILMERKQQELRRRTIEQQANGGFWQGTAKVGSGFAGMLVDPVNVAAAFVPVVGEARYVKLLAGADSLLGRTAIRAGVGAAEGTAGFAPVEGYNYATKQRIQADYTAYDSLLSLASGAAFGSALHAGGGFLVDTAGRALGFEPAWVRSARESRQRRADAVFEASDNGGPVPARGAAAADDAFTGQFAQEARERATILDRLAEGRPLTREAAEVQAVGNLRHEIRGELLASAGNAADPGVVASARSDLGRVSTELSGLESERRQLVKDINSRPGVTRQQAERLADEHLADRRLDLEARKARAESQIASNKDASEASAALSRFDHGEIPEAYRARVTAAADRLLGSTGEHPLSAGVAAALQRDPFMPLRGVLARMQPETQAQAFRMAIAQAAEGREIDVTPALLGDPSMGLFANDVGPLIRERTAATGAATADRAASTAAETQVANAYKGELVDEARGLVTAEETDLRALARQSGVDIEGALGATDEAIREANAAGEAGKAAAMCLMRTGE